MVTFLLSTGIVFYTLLSVLFSMHLLGRTWDTLADRRFEPIVERSETLALVVIVFGFPALFVGLVFAWPVLLYRQIRKEWTGG